MITAVDSNVLIDMLGGPAESQEVAKLALALAHHSGTVIISTIVYAELAPRFFLQEMLDEMLRDLDIAVSEIDLASAYLAGRGFLGYLRRGGTRERILADFLIGAHAANGANLLLTRDARFFATEFNLIDVMTPAAYVARRGSKAPSP